MDLSEAYAAHHFRANYGQFISILVCFILGANAVAIVDPNIVLFSSVAIACLVVTLPLRVWAHHSANQARALWVFSWAITGIILITLFIPVLALAKGGLLSNVSLLGLGCESMLRLLFTVFFSTNVMLPPARRVYEIGVLAFSAFLPPISELGWPAEPVLTCSAVAVGIAIGRYLDHARRLTFVAHRLPRDAADEAPCLVEKLPTHDFLSLSFADRELEDAYATHHFRATCAPVVVMFSCFLLGAGALAIVDPNMIPFSIAIGAGIAVVLLLRVWAHYAADQARALRAFSWTIAGLIFVVQIGQVTIGVDSNVSVLGLGCEAMMRLLFMIMMQTTIMPAKARVVIGSCFLVFSAVLPPVSELGWPAEPVLTCSAVVFGCTIGHSLDHARRLAFVAQARQRARDAADDAPCLVEKLPTHDFLSLCFADRELEHAYATHHFRATFGPVVGMSLCFLLGAGALAIVDPNMIPLSIAIGSNAVMCIIVRAWAHYAADQPRALSVFSWIISGLTSATVIAHNAFLQKGLIPGVSVLAMGCEAIIRMIFMIFMQITFMLPVARGVTMICALAFSSFLPPMSELGWPAEPVLASLAVLFGGAIGHSLDHARRLAFMARHLAEAEAVSSLALHGHEIRANMAGYISHEIRNDQNAIVGVLEHLTESHPQPPSLPTTPRAEMSQSERDLWNHVDHIKQLAPNLPSPALREASMYLSRLAPHSEGDELPYHLLFPDSVRAELCDALSHARHAAQVVTNMLEFAKLQVGELSLPTDKSFSPPGLCRECMQLVRHMVRTKPVELRTDCADDAPQTLLGAPEHLKQILLNLLTNAIKYTDTGSVTLRVTCLPSPQHTALQATASVGAKEGSTPLATATQPESTSEQVLLQFEVVDTGVGIPADCCDSIFKPFEHGPKVGTGLGLPICKALVELMGSKLLLKSSGGSTFSFAVPFSLPTDNQAAPVVAGEPASERANGQPAQSMPPLTSHDKLAPEVTKTQPAQPALPSGLRVLVADDERVNRLVLARKLKKILPKPLVVEAETGEAALQLLTEDAFDIAFLDEHMKIGGLTGTDVSRQIRQMDTQSVGEPGGHSIPSGKQRQCSPMLLIGCSGNADLDSYATLAQECGLDTVVGKPLPADWPTFLSRLVLERARGVGSHHSTATK